MATTLDSRRSVSPFAEEAGAVGTAPSSGNKNKTSTICFNLGLIFRRATHFFCPLQQNFHALVGAGGGVGLEV